MKNYKAINISQYAIFSVLLFMPGVVTAFTGIRFVAIKMAALIFGTLGGVGLQKALLVMETKKEKVLHLALVIFLVLLIAFIANIKSL